ncbi:TraG/TraD/VirD4 family protein [Gemmiger formicilis]|nr:TraG/TraD/VirD4 family protein [Gemmiger formicilis]
MAVQSYSQFLLKYDKNVTEIIKDNCQILLNTFVSPSAQDTASSISKMLGDETILTGSTSKSDGKTTSSHQLMGRPLFPRLRWYALSVTPGSLKKRAMRP